MSGSGNHHHGRKRAKFSGSLGYVLAVAGSAVGLGNIWRFPYLAAKYGGVLVALFAWPGGWSRMLWSLGVVVLVQQLEGGMLSPQLMSETTRLHPIVVLLCVMAGGAAGGVAGVLLAIPAVLCVRAALRVIQLKRLEEQFEET